MRNLLALLLLQAFLTSPSYGDENELIDVKIAKSGKDYLKSINRTSIGTSVSYLDPTTPLPPLETTQEPEVSKPQSSSSPAQDSGSILGAVITGGLLILIIYIIYKFGGGITLSSKNINRDVESARLNRVSKRNKNLETTLSYEEILKLPDRGLALVHLSRFALSTAAKLNGILIQPSWTVRDAISHLPRDKSYSSAVASMAYASEQILFGEREITEQEFQNFISTMASLLKAAKS